MKRRTILILIVIVLIGILGLPRMQADEVLSVRVTGRIVTSGHQSPVCGACITLLPEGVCQKIADGLRLATGEWETLLRDERMISHPRPTRGSIGRGTTWTDGVYHMQVVMRGAADGSPSRDQGCAPASPHGTWTLRIDIEDRAPIILDVPEGTWTEHDGEDGLWATWDLGVVEVPSTP